MDIKKADRQKRLFCKGLPCIQDLPKDQEICWQSLFITGSLPRPLAPLFVSYGIISNFTSLKKLLAQSFDYPNLRMDKITFSQEYSFRPLLSVFIIRFLSRPVILVMYLFWIGYLGLSIYNGLNSSDPIVDRPLLLIFVALILLYPYNIYRSARATYDVMEIYREEEGAFHVTDQALAFESPKYHMHIHWDLIDTVHETKEWFLVKLDARSILYLFKANMSPTDVVIFRTIVKSQPSLPSKLKS